MMSDAMVTALHFARTRWGRRFHNRAQLEAWQQARLQRFIREVLPRAPYYRDLNARTLSDLPIMDKAAMMADFGARNTRGIALEQAFAVGLQAEQTRDFLPLLGDLTVGLSSGTSGNRGVFLVSPHERLRWAGILLGHALPPFLLRRLLSPWQPPLRIAFFLRANSNLYRTLNSWRIDFAFYDVLLGVEAALPALNRTQPDIVVGPPALLRALAAEAQAGRLTIAPCHVISVADVLEDTDRAAAWAAWGVATHQLYQATEGFLGYTCAHGGLHLNERFVHIEPDWLDAEHTRFQPIVTDFTRDTQLIVRYRLNDVLRVADHPCPCGRVERTLAAIEGRADEVLVLPSRVTGRAVPIYPDLIRRALLLVGPEVREFDLVQQGAQMTLGVQLEGDHAAVRARIVAEFDALWQSLAVVPPSLVFTDWQPPLSGAKRRRVRRLSVPEGLICTF